MLVLSRLFPEVFEIQLRLEFGMIESMKRAPEMRKERLDIVVAMMVEMIMMITLVVAWC